MSNQRKHKSSKKRMQQVARKSYAAGKRSKKSHTGAIIGGILGSGGGPLGIALGAAIGSAFDK